MVKKIKLRKEFPNPLNIQKRLGISRRIKSIYRAGDEIIVELEGDEEVTREEKRKLKKYFNNNPYWEVVE